MKTQNPIIALALLALSTLNPHLSTVFAQGSLTPPGPPGPTMLTLNQIEARTPISSLPFTITGAGSYYLTTNVTGISGADGITVSAGNVTIDLNGFALFGVSGAHSGVYVSGSYSNITVRNGSLSGWGYNGVDAANANPSGVLLERLSASGNNNFGISTGNSVVRDCVCLNNGEGGIYVSAASLISDCSLIYNTNVYTGGLVAYGDCVARDCQLGFNYTGVIVFGGRCEVCDSQINSNAADGIYISFSGTPGVTACASTISHCSLLGNAHNGINMQGVANSIGSPATVSDCSVVANGQTGINLNFSPWSRVSNCNVVSNGLSGIYIGGDDSSVVGNSCVANNGSGNTNNAGILIRGNTCLVEDNHLMGNGYAGIAITFGVNSIVVKNTITDGYAFFGSNDIGPIGAAATATSPWANIFH